MMRKIAIPLILVLLLLAGCRREEPATPAAQPTTAPAATNTAQPVAAPAATATRPAPPTAAAAAPGLGRIDPEAIDWPPQILYASPLPGEETLLDGAITIRFDQPMDQRSVEQAFEIEPAGEPGDTIPGAFAWPEADTLVFTPQGKLARNESYRVLIGTRAAGRNGQRLQEPIALQFQTVGALEVAQVIPADGTEGIGVDASVTVLFNRPVVPLVSTGQQQDLPQPLTIEPAVDGQGEWVSTSIFRFTPDEAFEGATEYLVTIPAGLEDITGSVLEEAVTSTFTTLQPSVAQIVPGTGETEVAPTATMTVTFNMAMDRGATEAAVSLNPSAPVAFSWENDRTLVITPDGLLSFGTRYTLAVGEQARAASGAATLDRTTTSTFTTVPLPRVVRTSPRTGEEAPPYQFGISIEFSAPVDPDTVIDQIVIEPVPADADYYVGGKWVSVDFPMERKTTYTVSLPGSVADPYGNTLGEPYVWQFTTAPLPALVSLNLAPNVSQLHSAPPTTVDVVYRNVSQIDVALYDLGLRVTTLLEPYRVNEMGVPGAPLREWRLSPDSPEDTPNYATVDLGDIANGVYLMSASAPEVRREYWQNQRNLLVIADTNVVVKEMFGAVHVWVTALANGEPAPGRELTLYSVNGTEVGTATSDANGFASFDYDPPRDYLPGVVVVAGEPGADNFGAGSSNWIWNASPWEFGINVTSGDEAEEVAYIYTDRPIYRPGDTVHYRGIVRSTDYARYGLPEHETATVRVEYFSWYEPSQQLEEVTLPLDEYGAFSGEFSIPEDAALGEYQISLPVEGPNENTWRRFTVAEYRRPEFSVTVTPGVTQTLRGEAVDVTVEARYFFGAPASDLVVDWIVRELPYRLHREGPPYYSFTDEDIFYYFGGWEDDYSGRYVTEGTGRTDAEGRFTVTLPPDLLAEVDAGSRTVTLEATVRDVSEFPVTANAQIIFHAAEHYVGIAADNYLAQSGEETAVR
ncbi:MAG: Ig-like domain-containing protein, partial [Anaerolineae bacterium]|nr:Ig-like domain-containing protein [Anaerolineae bacterium]